MDFFKIKGSYPKDLFKPYTVETVLSSVTILPLPLMCLLLPATTVLGCDLNITFPVVFETPREFIYLLGCRDGNSMSPNLPDHLFLSAGETCNVSF